MNDTLSMAGLVPAIHVFLSASKTWMPGIKPGMTSPTMRAAIKASMARRE
jgi:hypothetical protein